MPAENTRKYTPPYISPRTFQHLLEELEKSVPERMDRTYLDGMFSGSTATQVMAALRYLGLADGIRPTPQLRLLVDARGDERTKRLKDLTQKNYTFVFDGITNSGTATYGQIEELFTNNFNVDGDVRRKCIKFFTSLATSAGIALSPHITKKVRVSQRIISPRVAIKKVPPKTPVIEAPPVQVHKPREAGGLLEKILEKFPDYDIGWTVEQKHGWVEDFTTFVNRVYPETKR